jgi:hypothetical protein
VNVTRHSKSGQIDIQISNGHSHLKTGFQTKKQDGCQKCLTIQKSGPFCLLFEWSKSAKPFEKRTILSDF